MLRGLGADSFSITGNRIDLKLERRELTYLLAKGNGHAVSQDWELVADTIALDVNHRKLDQTLAWGDSLKPSATSVSYAMKADSLVLDTPGQQLREVRGFGTGLARRDGLRADEGPRLDARRHGRRQVRGAGLGRQRRAVLSQIVARKAAQSYHLEPNDRAPRQPSINYARGDVITVTMKNGPHTTGSGVERVDIRGKVDGVQLEAAPPSAAPDTTPRRRSAAMSAPEWIAALGDRDPSVPIALAAITRAAGASDTVDFGDLVMSYREAHIACHRPLNGPAQVEITGDEVRDHLSRSVLPRLATEGWILESPDGDWNSVRPRVPWWGQTPEARQDRLRRTARGRPPRGAACQAGHRTGQVGQRPGGHATWRRASRAGGSWTTSRCGSSRARSSVSWGRTARERRRPSTLLRG